MFAIEYDLRGETSRYFYTHISEHEGITPGTNRPHSKSPSSDV